MYKLLKYFIGIPLRKYEEFINNKRGKQAENENENYSVHSITIGSKMYAFHHIEKCIYQLKINL